MGRRVHKAHRWADEPGRLLGHDGPYDIWAKLDWEAHQFAALSSSQPPLDIDGMVYLLQNACISAVAAVEWLEKVGVKAARLARRGWDAEKFVAVVLGEIPTFALARAVANTFKHATYRDEGWDDAAIRLEALFSLSQHERLRALQGTDAFSEAYAEEAAGARFDVSFTRAGSSQRLDAERFVLDIAHGVLRLIDSTIDELEQFFTAGAPG